MNQFSRTFKRSALTGLVSAAILMLTACLPVTRATSIPVTLPVSTAPASGHITSATIDIELEQGSGVVCRATSTYFVRAHLTADGPTVASYEIGSTAGQIPAGYFQTADSASPSPYVTGSLVFDQADTQTVNLRFVGPYPHPDDITVNLRVDGGEWHNTKLACQP
jgi:hypothetical protein